MSRDRVIPAQVAKRRQLEGFPYFTAGHASGLRAGEGDDEPVSASLSTPEEDAARLASVDQIIFERLQQAEREAQEIARRAYEEGFAAGEREGREFGESQYRHHLQRLDATLLELSRTASLVGKASEEELLALVMTMAEYLASQQLDRSPQSVRPLLDTVLSTHALAAAGPGDGTAKALVVFLHPRDLHDLRDTYVGYGGLKLVEDTDLSRGSLRLEALDGVLEATLESRRERLMEALHRFRELDSQ
jgi:flagellar assembly protein FliH